MTTKKLRLTLISEMLQPYRIPVFNRIAENPDAELKVLALSVREKNRKWDVPLESCLFDYEVLPGRNFYIGALDWGLHITWGVTRALKKTAPDVVVGTGYASPAYLVAQRYAKRNRSGYVLWSGSTVSTSRIGKGPIRSLKKNFLRRCDAFLSYGTEATKALVVLGADPNRIVTGRNTVDVEYYAHLAADAKASPTFHSWRSQYPPKLILYVGQMVDRKGVMDLIEAFGRANHPGLGLLLVGEGPERERYQRAARTVDRVFWAGYVQSQEMGPYLAAANVLVMPSHLEPWGLVINEAMAAGVPVIATTCSGAATDLVIEGETGYRYQAGDVDQLASLLQAVAEDPASWAEMGKRAAQRMASCTPKEYAEDFLLAARKAIEHL